jgi:hypothetical protein
MAAGFECYSLTSVGTGKDRSPHRMRQNRIAPALQRQDRQSALRHFLPAIAVAQGDKVFQQPFPVEFAGGFIAATASAEFIQNFAGTIRETQDHVVEHAGFDAWEAFACAEPVEPVDGNQTAATRVRRGKEAHRSETVRNGNEIS